MEYLHFKRSKMTDQTSLSWSSTLKYSLSTDKYTDKIVLPDSVLQSLVAQTQTLPSPLTFKISNSRNSKFTHVGVREFSGDEHKVVIPSVVADRLDLTPDQQVSINYAYLPKGSSVILEVEGEADWKPMLESGLRQGYTAMTKGDIIVIEDGLRCLVKDLKPEDAVCVVDTDMDLDIIEPLNAAIARSQNKKIERVPLELSVSKSENIKEFDRDTPLKASISQWTRSEPLIIKLNSDDTVENVDIFAGIEDYATSDKAFIWSTLSSSPNKQIKILPGNQFLVSNNKPVEKLHFYISTKSDKPIDFSISILEGEQDEEMEAEEQPAGTKQCPNCKKFISENSYQMHTMFCERNNILCPNGCGQLFLRSAGGIPATHWHCSECTAYGNTALSLSTHQETIHTPGSCSACSANFSNFVSIGFHRATDCPKKLHICRFCHLLVPQGETTAVDRLNGFTAHESQCGSRTTECPICGKIFKLNLLPSHLEYHNAKRLSSTNTAPQSCSNPNCTHLLNSPNPLRLCAICFGPLHSTVYDPDGTKLKMRIERRYVIQLSRGCGKSFCTNYDACATANPSLKTAGIKRVLEQVQNDLIPNNKMLFCVDESTTKRKLFVDMLTEEGIYDREWIVKAMEDAKGNESKARQWLELHAKKISEQ